MKKLSTTQACEMFGVNRQRLNEDIAAGIYDCAPETINGRTRLWDDVDLAGLFVYQHFCDAFKEHSRFPKLMAAKYARAVMDVLRSTTDATGLRVDLPVDGFNDLPIISRTSEPPQKFNEEIGVGALCAVMSIDLGDVAKWVQKLKPEKTAATYQEIAEDAQKIAES